MPVTAAVVGNGRVRAVPTGDPCSLASSRLPPVLALEISLSWRPTEDRRGPARVDPADERGKSVVGSTTHPWRVAQARFRGRSVERREVHGQAMRPPVPGMADLPAYPRSGHQ